MLPHTITAFVFKGKSEVNFITEATLTHSLNLLEWTEGIVRGISLGRVFTTGVLSGDSCERPWYPLPEIIPRAAHPGQNIKAGTSDGQKCIFG